MNVERIKNQHINELNKWVESLGDLPTPSSITPKTLHDYPACIQTADRMKRFCGDRAKTLKAEILKSEDAVMSVIEAEKYVLRTSRLGVSEYRKTFTTAAAREREMRIRLGNDEAHAIKVQEQIDWDRMAKDWGSHCSKLHREFRILEDDFMHTGNQQINVSAEFK